MDKLEYLAGDFIIGEYQHNKNHYIISVFDNGNWQRANLEGITKDQLKEIRDKIDEFLV